MPNIQNSYIHVVSQKLVNLSKRLGVPLLVILLKMMVSMSLKELLLIAVTMFGKSLECSCFYESLAKSRLLLERNPEMPTDGLFGSLVLRLLFAIFLFSIEEEKLRRLMVVLWPVSLLVRFLMSYLTSVNSEMGELLIWSFPRLRTSFWVWTWISRKLLGTS